MYTTGVIKSVSSCDRMSPPTTATPSGWRNSAPAPWQRAEDRRERRHHDRPEAQEARLAHRRFCAHADAPALDRKIDHHDCILLDDADQHDDADHGDD